MNIKDNIDLKSIFRITGTPENFLTALRYSIWGFNEKLKGDWEKLNTGDILFFHSKKSDSRFLKTSISCVIGFGVVGDSFFIDDTPLWIDERDSSVCYPYRFNFSEIYFFYNVPINNDWDSTTIKKIDGTKEMLLKVVDAGIPLSQLNGFPHMGSYSSINNQSIKKQLFDQVQHLYLYQGYDDLYTSKRAPVLRPSTLEPINSAEESIRYHTSLRLFEDISKKVVHIKSRTVVVDTELLEKAESAHYNIIKTLLSLFKEKGYQTYNNKYVDLYAYKGDRSFLVEAKSIENINFKVQSRKAIAQLLEYSYFEVPLFKQDNKLMFNQENLLLATSSVPHNPQYIQFLNSINIKTIAIRDNEIINYGSSIDISKI